MICVALRESPAFSAACANGAGLKNSPTASSPSGEVTTVKIEASSRTKDFTSSGWSIATCAATCPPNE
jgi:hypothetical protein